MASTGLYREDDIKMAKITAFKGFGTPPYFSRLRHSGVSTRPIRSHLCIIFEMICCNVDPILRDRYALCWQDFFGLVIVREPVCTHRRESHSLRHLFDHTWADVRTSARDTWVALSSSCCKGALGWESSAGHWTNRRV